MFKIIKKYFVVPALIAFALPVLRAQDTGLPNIAYVYPSGAGRGEKVKITVGGRNFKDFRNAYFSAGGVEYEVDKLIIPSLKNEANALRKKIQKLAGEKYKASDAIELNKITELARKNGDFPELFEQYQRSRLMYKVREYSSDPLAETVTLYVKIPEDAPLGKTFFKIQTAKGVSNTVPFYIDNLPEFVKPCMRTRVMELLSDGNNKKVQALLSDESRGIVIPHSSEPVEVKPPLIVNGQICLKATDRYSFEAKKGSRMVFAVMARALIAYLGDAVPGWFQPSITLYNSKGDEIAYSDDFYQYPDPLLSVVIPADGRYTIEIKDAVFRGREDFVYRMLIGQVPYITGIFPLGAKTGEDSVVRIVGWNLEDNTLSFKNPASGVKYLKMHSRGVYHSDVPFQVSDLTQFVEVETNDEPATANQVPFPVAIDGRIETKNDKDCFKTELKKGSKIVAEIFARRLNSPTDSFLKIRAPNGEIIAFNDDAEDPSEGMITHHADSRVMFTAPQDGQYVFEVSETQSKFGGEYSYRLLIDTASADYSLKIDKTTLTVAAGKTAAFKVYAFRKNGVDYPIKLRLKNAPEGYVLSGGYIPEKCDSANVTISVPANAPVGLQPLEIEGQGRGARSGGLVRSAKACEYMLQAFYINHLVPMGEKFELFVLPQPKNSNFIMEVNRILSSVQNKTLKLARGKDTVLTLPPVKGLRGVDFKAELGGAPAGVAIKSVSLSAKGSSVVFSCDANAEVWSGNMIVQLYYARVFKNKNKGKWTYLNSLPALRAEIK